MKDWGTKPSGNSILNEIQEVCPTSTEGTIQYLIFNRQHAVAIK